MRLNRQAASVAFISVVGMLIAFAAASRLWLLPVHFSGDPNEGWNAFQAARALGAGPLYPAPGGLIGNNYPPLSFYVVGLLGRLVGDPIIAGRLLAAASLATVGVTVAAITRRIAGPGLHAGTVAMLLFFALNATVLRRYLALNDPQWFAHALMMLGILVLVPQARGRAPVLSNSIGGALLMVAGGLTKHNLVAWPIAATLWLLLHHRRSLLPWIATALAIGVVAAALAYQSYGAAFFIDIAASPRHYSGLRMIHRATVPLLVTVPMLILALPIAKDRSDARVDLILMAILIAVPIGMIQRSGDGVDINAHFEGFIALSIGCALAYARVMRREQNWGLVRRALVPALFLAVLLGFGFAAELREIRTVRGGRAAWAEMERSIRSIDGVVACQTTALCFWAGEPFVLDFFLYGQRAARDGDVSQLMLAMNQGRIAAIELDPLGRSASAHRTEPIAALIEGRPTAIFTDSKRRRLMAITK